MRRVLRLGARRATGGARGVAGALLGVPPAHLLEELLLPACPPRLTVVRVATELADSTWFGLGLWLGLGVGLKLGLGLGLGLEAAGEPGWASSAAAHAPD